MGRAPTSCALVGASAFNARDFRARAAAGLFDLVVAVDGGYAHLRDAGAQPDAAVGDFDSLGFVPEDVPAFVHPPEKDDSDMALACDYALDRGCSQLWLYGALGGRLDHTLANLQLCARYAEAGALVTAVDEDCALRLVVGPGALELPAGVRGVVSVFSACDESRGVTERGLKYALEDWTLGNRTSRGLSNELTGRPSRISVREGSLYVFCPPACL